MIVKFEQKWLVCLVYGCITGTNGWNATKFTLTSLEKDKEFIMFDDMRNISRSQQVMNQNCHHGMVWVVVGRGVLFSLRRLMYFHCYLTLLDR